MRSKYFAFILLCVIALGAIMGCNKKDYDQLAIMTMTSNDAKISIDLGGTGSATVHWPDGDQTLTLSPDNGTRFSRTYDAAQNRTITISGKNITSLYCDYDYGLLTLDVSNNTKLNRLTIFNSPLTSLDVSGCYALRSLYFERTKLTSLDVSECTALKTLQAIHNSQLTSLDVSRCTALETLSVFGSSLTSLDVSRCTALETLSVNKSNLTSLDVSRCTALEILSVFESSLTSLDVSRCTMLSWLKCDNNQLTAAALDALFEMLPKKSIGSNGAIFVGKNPGTNTCNQIIAIRKRWMVLGTYVD